MSAEPDSNQGLGIIYPPPDIRGVIDKTAQFVAKCGPEFEQRVLREQNHTKFAFLLPSNPYRPYYEHKVKEFKTGVVEESKPEVPQAIVEQRAKEDEKKRKKEQLKMLTMGGKAKREAKPPPPDQFVVNHPYIAPMDMDIIKLTAQFVARNGQKFLIGLTQRESRNPQFDFLKPTHALFGYFTSLVDSYTKCLMPNKEEVEKLKKAVQSMQDIIDKANSRYAWDEQEEAQRVSKEEEAKEEKDMMAQIDWHDFMVVETIEFTAEDDNLQLAAPIDTSTGAPQGAPVPLDQSTGKAGTFTGEAKIVEKPKEPEEDPEETTKVEQEKAEAERKAREQKEKEEKEREEKEKEEQERAEKERQQAEIDIPMEEEDPVEQEPDIPMPAQDPEMKVRKDYVRHRKSSTQRIMQRCPITGQLIPAEEMSHHLKVLLLDPKWKHQKDALVERARKESAFADDVEANLAGFVAKRPDLFGSVDEQIKEAAEAGAEASAREAGADAGPAHTMVPPTAATLANALPGAANKALPSGAGGGLNLPALAGPITGISTVNARLPSAALPASIPSATMGEDSDDSDEEAAAKKPRLGDGTTVGENAWLQKHPMPIQILVQVQIPEAAAANIPSMIPLELSVRSKVLEMKHMLAPKVAGAGVNAGTMKVTSQNAGYKLKNSNTLAFYNIGPGNVLVLGKKESAKQQK
eukprot:TRINITY_DN6443_c0_g1_i1.p1 TRINITY_DN6443_c0_g1~~TRINITY_DN6443_c0_g1_i1.p1  ORF type:complete len:691 (+),score=245.88 TRINITY_DN6443_c0_g1_i1:74-2146(+)